MRIPLPVIEMVKEIDKRYRQTWDIRAIAHVTRISHGSVSKILREVRCLRPIRNKPAHDRRTKFNRCDAMWSSDFTKMSNGKELVKTLDEKSDYKLGWDIVDRENADELLKHAQDILFRMGRKPLVWKFDNGSGFKSKKFRNFLKENNIMPYPIRSRTPWTNGRTERDHYEAQKWMFAAENKELTDKEYAKEINDGLFMLNFIKPRSVLNYKTSASVYFNDPGINEAEREKLFEEVKKLEEKDVKCKSKHRRAVREVLDKLGLYEEWLSGKKEAENVNRTQS